MKLVPAPTQFETYHHRYSARIHSIWSISICRCSVNWNLALIELSWDSNWYTHCGNTERYSHFTLIRYLAYIVNTVVVILDMGRWKHEQLWMCQQKIRVRLPESNICWLSIEVNWIARMESFLFYFLFFRVKLENSELFFFRSTIHNLHI